MDKLAQIRQLREDRDKRRASAIMSRRAPPSRAQMKEIADRAEARSPSTVILPQPKEGMTVTIKAGASPIIVKPRTNETLAYGGGRQQGKTNKMDAAQSQDWNKASYMVLYQRVRRAKTDEEREAAQKALREAFPKTRPRAERTAVLIVSGQSNGTFPVAPRKTKPPVRSAKIAPKKKSKPKAAKKPHSAKRAKKKGSR